MFPKAGGIQVRLSRKDSSPYPLESHGTRAKVELRTLTLLPHEGHLLL